MSYEFKWKPELAFAILTFIIFFLVEFAQDTEITDWKAWLMGTLLAGARAVAAALVPRLTALLSRLVSGTSSSVS